MKLSVVIPSYNSRNTIHKCLAAVCGQPVQFEYEVIVVDSSDDGSEEVIRHEFPQVRLIHLQERTIPAVARNLGIEAAKAEDCAFVDSDCIPTKDWLGRVAEALKSDIEVLCGGIINAHPYNPISVAEYFLEFREFSIHSPLRETEAFLAANFALRKSVVRRFGGFPVIRASEDTLFNHKLKANGIKVFFDPKVQVYHQNRTRLRPYLRNQQLLGRNSAIARSMVRLVGSRWAQRPILAPVLPMVRSLRTLHFIFQNRFPFNLSQTALFVLTLPWFFLGACAWSRGFYRGMRDGLGDGQGSGGAPAEGGVEKSVAALTDLS